MATLLVVDDEDATRQLVRARLEGEYTVIDTGDPEQALALALEHKPDAILLDLLMPHFSGFELCRTFNSLTFTQHIPVFVISGEAAERYRSFCHDLGATAYFQKPIDFSKLKEQLSAAIARKDTSGTREVRLALRVVLTLAGCDSSGTLFQTVTTTDDVSANGFSCSCSVRLAKDSPVKVYTSGGEDQQYVGEAVALHSEWADRPMPRYSFRFVNRPDNWILQ